MALQHQMTLSSLNNSSKLNRSATAGVKKLLQRMRKLFTKHQQQQKQGNTIIAPVISELLPLYYCLSYEEFQNWQNEQMEA